jgi:hypothetical protein
MYDEFLSTHATGFTTTDYPFTKRIKKKLRPLIYCKRGREIHVDTGLVTE